MTQDKDKTVLNRREMFSGMAALLGASKLTIGAGILQAAAEALNPPAPLHAPAFLLRQLTENTGHGIRGIRGRFILNERLYDPQNLERLRDSLPRSMEVKAKNMATLHSVFDQLAQHPTEAAKAGLQTMVNGEGFGGDEYVDEIVHQLGGWPLQGGDAARDALKETFAQERDDLFSYARAQLSAEQAAQVERQYHTQRAAQTEIMEERFTQTAQRLQQNFAQEVRHALSHERITLQVEDAGDSLKMHITFNPDMPMEGSGAMIPSGSGYRFSSYEAIKTPLEALMQQGMLPAGSTRLDGGMAYDEATKMWRSHEMTISSRTPAMQQLIRGLSREVLQHALLRKLEQGISHLRDAVSQPAAEGMVEWRITLDRPRGHAQLAQQQSFMQQLQEEIAMLESAGGQQIQWNPRERSLTLQLREGEAQQLQQRLEEISAQPRGLPRT